MKTIIFDKLIDPKTGENISVEIEEDENYLAHLEKVNDKASRSGQLLAAAHTILDRVIDNCNTIFPGFTKELNEN